MIKKSENPSLALAGFFTESDEWRRRNEEPTDKEFNERGDQLATAILLWFQAMGVDDLRLIKSTLYKVFVAVAS